ncbi:signal peptidase I [Streptomyces sp. NPDC049040]|uniref:signal peptidase I n=1 Tax=Streptomyces sp. NPDC049040 TaxID=3365593 RepID=UPI003712CCB4
MDTEAAVPERDRSPAADEAEPGERSRFAVLGGWLAPRLPVWWAQWRRTILLALAGVAAMMLVSTFVLEPFQVPSGSMEGTLRVGDRVLVDKLAYRFGGTPRRGDVIVFDGDGSLTQESGTDFVKRVIGVGGDRITCCDAQGRLLVNGHPLDETYLYPGDTPSRVPFDIVVPDGRLWVMGDHRDDSRDSRDHLGDPGGGTVPVGRVIGRADWIGWPVGHWTRLRRPATFAGVPAPAGAHG